MRLNLKAELIRKDLNPATAIRKCLLITERTARKKISGESEISMSQMTAIQQQLLPDCEMSYEELFKDFVKEG